MSDVQVTVQPDHLELKPGESAQVVVSVAPTSAAGKVLFPVKSSGGRGEGLLTLSMPAAAIFLEPKTQPEALPVDVILVESTSTSATYKVTAKEPQLSRGERRSLERDG